MIRHRARRPRLALTAALAAALAGTLASAPAVSAQSLVVTGGAGWRSTTGVGGSYAPQSLTAPAGMVLIGLRYAEYRNSPCLVEATWWRPGASTISTEWRNSSRCDNQSHYLGVNSSTSVPRALRWVRVCNRRSNDRIKGVRVRGANITASGAQPDPGLFREHDRPNCNGNWSSSVSQCPNGQAITRVRIETRDIGVYDARGAVGLGVFCSRVRLAG